jgi:hypothetical protein
LPETYDADEIMADLNATYNTMSVYWGKGNELIILSMEEYEKKDKSNRELLDDIYEKLKEHPQYKKNEYYMIFTDLLEKSEAGLTITTNDEPITNHCFINYINYPYTENQKYTPAHELGHCNGLGEMYVDIGSVPDKKDYQHNSSNVMGYRNMFGTPPVIDFYSWQIPLLRESIEKIIMLKP